MEKIIIEIQAEHSVYRTHRSFDRLPVRIGRGYENDLILDDPFLSENHVMIAAQDGKWILKDMGSQNGTYVVKESRVIDECEIVSGDTFIIGKTKIRVVHQNHPVPPPKILVFRSPFIKKISQPINALSITIFMLIIYMLQEYYESVKNYPAVKLISESVGILVLIGIWAGLWAFVGRLIKKNAQFTAQLSLTALYCILLVPAYYLCEFLGYAITDLFQYGILAAIIYGCLFMLLLIKNLQIATSISLLKRSIVSFLLTTLLIMIGVLSHYADNTEFYPYPKFNATVKPPLVKVVPSATISAFLNDSEEVF